VFSVYNIIYISQYSRQCSFLWYKNAYVTCNTGCYIDVLFWVIFDPMHKHLNYSRCIYGPLKAVLILESGFQVDFRYERSLNTVLGFNKAVYTSDYQESENRVDILSINSILVNVDIISGSYVNGQRNRAIYSFFPAVSPGYKIIETPANSVYLPVTLDAIYSMETSLTDQNGKLLNLR